MLDHHSPEPLIPDHPRIPEHTVLRRIGVGAYGQVWLARNAMGVSRAVKVVRRDRFEHARIYEREFAGLKKFEPVSRSHAGLVDILQVGRDDAAGYFYYVMELADDAVPAEQARFPEHYRPLTLAEHIARGGGLGVSECARVGSALAEALAFLHGRGLVHRDIKPSNIIYVGGQPKLADVGLVAGLGDARSFVGTEGFIAPEGPGSPPADIYSLGKVLYEMATGKSRLDFPDLPANLPIPADAQAFAELNETILRACAAEPSQRHATAQELRAELLLVDAGRSVRGFRRNERLLATWRRIGLISCLLGLVVLFAWVVERGRLAASRRVTEAEVRQRQALEERELAAQQNLYAADLNLVQQAMEAGNYGRAEELLAAYRPRPAGPDLRSFEWFYYWSRVRGDSIGVARGHEQVVSSLALSPDGLRLFSASFDGTVREWSVAERAERQRWTLPGALFGALALDAAGQRLALTGGNRPLYAWLDLATGAWITNVGSVSASIAFTPEDTHLAHGVRSLLFDTNGVVEIADLQFKTERTLPESGGRLAFAPDGRTLATGPWSDAIRLWSWPAGDLLGTLPGAGTVMAMSFSPDGARLASVARDGRLQMWDWRARRLLASTFTHARAIIWSVAFSPDGSRLATGGNDQTVRLWEADTLAERHVYRGHGSEVWSVIWSKDGRQLISAGKDTTIRWWEADPAPPPAETSEVMQAVAFSPDERLLAVRLRPGEGVVRETASGKTVMRLGPLEEIGGFGADGSLAVLAPGWVFQRRSVPTGEVLESRPLAPPPEAHSKRFLTPDGRWLATGLRDGGIYVHDIQTSGEPFMLEGHQEMILALAVSPDGTQLLAGCLDRTATLWDLRSRRLLHSFVGSRMGVSAVAFSADGTRLATGSWDDTIHVWDAASRRRVAVLGGHVGGVQALAFAPGQRTLVSLAGNGDLKFWCLAARREAGAIQLAQGRGQAWVSLSRAGHWLGVVSQAEVLSLFAAPAEIERNHR